MWINLAQKDKKQKPDYQILEPEAVLVVKQGNSLVRVLVGEGSPVRLYTPTLFLDVTLSQKGQFLWQIPEEHHGFVYILEGKGKFGAEGDEGNQGQLLILGLGDQFTASALSDKLRFILGAAQPHREPVRWYGPFVD